MTFRYRWLAASPILLAIGLTACGDSGVNSVAPPPVAAPTPTPTPAAVSPFPSAGGPTYYSGPRSTIGGDATIRQSADGTAEVAEFDRIEIVGAPVYMNIAYLGPNNYSIELAGFGGPEFLPSELDATHPLFDIFRQAGPTGYRVNLELAKKNVGVALTYATFGSVTELSQSGPATGEADISFFAAGSMTPASQMPRTGAGAFAGIADGLWIDGATTRRLYGSPATLTANFATGEIVSTLELRGHSDPFGDFASAPTTVLGTFSGTGAISGFTFTGSYGPSAGYSGSFLGQFFGPVADEYGLAFSLTGAPGQSAVGVAVGTRD